MTKGKYTQKEKNLFFIGIVAGIGGGLITNFLVASFFKVFDNLSKWVYAIIFIISLIFFFGSYYYLFKQIK